MAKELGYDIGQIKGSGDNGRVIKKDVEAYTPSAVAAPVSDAQAAAVESTFIPAPVVVGEESFEEVQVSQMRKTIAKRLSEMTQKLEDISNQLYHLQQRVELLERKSGVNY